MTLVYREYKVKIKLIQKQWHHLKREKLSFYKVETCKFIFSGEG